MVRNLVLIVELGAVLAGCLLSADADQGCNFGSASDPSVESRPATANSTNRTLNSAVVEKNGSLVFAESKTFAGHLIDYDRQSPIASAKVQLFARAKNRADWIDTGRSATSDASGRFSFANLTADGEYRIRVSHPDYHRFDQFDLTFSFRYKNFEKETKVKLLSKNAYRRVMESARLSMPDTSGLSTSETFAVLSKRFDADQVIHKQIVNQQVQILTQGMPTRDIDPFQQFMVRTRLHPIDLYRDAMWRLAGNDGATDTQYRALVWLADPDHTDKYRNNFRSLTWPIELKNAGDQNQNAKLAVSLVDRFVENGLLAEDMTSFVKTFHPDPEKALNRVLRDHPNRVTQAAAAVELGNLLSEYHPNVRRTGIIESVAQRQIQERQVWQLVKDKYNDVHLGQRQVSAGETASRMLEFLDSYGVDGLAPEMSGKTVMGETVRLGDYHGKLTILHFCSYERLEIYDDLRLIRDQYPDAVRLLGVVFRGQHEAERLLDRNLVDWPVLRDPRSDSGFFASAGGRPIPGTPPLKWGTEDALRLEHFETWVIDSTGKVLAVGLTGSELEAFVAEQLAN